VMNAQRKEVYAQRKEFMKADDVAETVASMREEIIHALVSRRIPERAFAEQWELTELQEDVQRILNLDLPVVAWGREEGIDEERVTERINQAADSMMAAKAANIGPELMRFVEKSLLIQVMDQVWKEHLLDLDHLRQGISLRAYGQRDPLNEYKSEAFTLFNAMLDEMKERVTSLLARVELNPNQPADAGFERPAQPMFEQHPEPESLLAHAPEGEVMEMRAGPNPMEVAAQPMRSQAVDPADPATWRSTGRNAPCPCGSGRKYKQCHGRLS